jgi:hypothetical protein
MGQTSTEEGWPLMSYRATKGKINAAHAETEIAPGTGTQCELFTEMPGLVLTSTIYLSKARSHPG